MGIVTLTVSTRRRRVHTPTPCPVLEGALPTAADPFGSHMLLAKLQMDLLRTRSRVRLAPISVLLSLINPVTHGAKQDLPRLRKSYPPDGYGERNHPLGPESSKSRIRSS